MGLENLDLGGSPLRGVPFHTKGPECERCWGFMRNCTALHWTQTHYLAVRPSRTPDPGLGLTVKVPFLFILKRHFNILLIRLWASRTPRRPRPSYHVSCFRLTIHFPYLIFPFFPLFFSIFPLSTSLLVYMVRARGIVLPASALATNMYKRTRRLVCAHIALSI